MSLCSHVCAVSRDVGKTYAGTVTAFNSEGKRHKVEFDDGDCRWFRMERKIFTLEDGEKQLSWEGEMKVRRSPAGPEREGGTVTRSGDDEDRTPAKKSPTKAKPKTPKQKKINKSIKFTTFMQGVMTVTGDSSVIEGFWDESKARVGKEDKRDGEKTFCITQKCAPSTLAEKDFQDGLQPQRAKADDDDSDDDDVALFTTGNCGGWFRAKNQSGEYTRYDDEMMLRTFPVEVDSEDEDSEAKRGGLEVRAVGMAPSGAYRLRGKAEVDAEATAAAAAGATVFSVSLVREYLHDDHFEEEKFKFDKAVDGSDEAPDDGMVRLAVRGRHVRIPEVRRAKSNSRARAVLLLIARRFPRTLHLLACGTRLNLLLFACHHPFPRAEGRAGALPAREPVPRVVGGARQV